MPAERAGRVPRWRRGLATLLLVVSGVLLPLGLLAGWANTTFYDSDTFSQRAVDLLDSQTVRRELADRLTEQLALNGNQQAVNFRPAFQLAIETAIDTDTFRSIFRNAVRRTHQTVLAGRESGTALDLSDSLAIIQGTLQLPSNAQPGQRDEAAFGSSLTDVTDRLAKLGVWRYEDVTKDLFLGGVIGAALAAAVAIALAADRRRMVAWLGIAMVIGGLALSGLVLGTQWLAGRLIGDAELAAAVRAAVANGMGDLSSIGLWTAGYGVVIAAAARASQGRRLSPSGMVTAIRGWADRRRTSTAGTMGLSAAAVAAGLILVRSPWFWSRVAILAAGLWLVYFGVAEVAGLLTRKAPAGAEEGDTGLVRAPRPWVLAGAGAALLLVATAGMIVTTARAAKQANAAGELRCNGESSLCDLPLNLAVFPGTHNSMSSALYPGWLFAEHVRTIGGQLGVGARALLIDTHYGVESSARMPGSETPVVLTDRAAELRQPVGEEVDPAIEARARELASRASPRVNANRDLYLCHNYCELGAVTFSDALGEIKTFLDRNPDDVVMTIIQDATTPADTAAAIEAAGLGERVWTLDPNKPLPTLGDMIRAGRTLLVFAENGGAGAPPWYQPAYETWFQETPYAFTSASDMSCGPNRGPATAPLFIVNHWVTNSPPDPRKAAAVNAKDVLQERLRRCRDERDLVPNVVAADFADRGDLFKTAQSLNDELLDQVRSARPTAPKPGPATSTTAPAGGPSPEPLPASSEPPLPTPTVIGSLTGGNAKAFCDRVPDTVAVIGAWALSDAVAPPAIDGLSDLAFGAAAAREIAAAEAVAPHELAARLVPVRDRASAAVAVLRELGLDQAAIDDLAQLAQTELARPESPDPVTVQETVLQRLEQRVDAERLRAAAQAFVAANPEPPGLFDLGEVPDDVARSAGYDCLA